MMHIWKYQNNVLYLSKIKSMKYLDLLLFAKVVDVTLSTRTTKGEMKLLKVYEKLRHHVEDYNAKLDDIRIDLASTDEKNNVIMVNGEYQFTKDAMKELKVKVQALKDSDIENFKPVEVVNPKGLEDYVFLKGWVNGVEFNETEEEEL